MQYLFKAKKESFYLQIKYLICMVSLAVLPLGIFAQEETDLLTQSISTPILNNVSANVSPVFKRVLPDSFTTIKKRHWLENSPTLNKKRLAGVVGVTSGLFAVSMVGLDRAWYAQYPRSKFHFFDDSREWNQIDKCGHIFSPYFISVYTYHALRWSGMKKVPAALTSGSMAFTYIAFIELLDGFSSKWGASVSDLGADFFGAALATTQFAIWGEQRIQLKYSLHLNPYPRGELQQRADNLFGTSIGEKIIKDYNNINTWLCINTSSFFKSQKHAKWLNIAIGYGAGNMYGGFENKWTDKNGNLIDRTDVKRYRKFFISIDADLTKVKTNNKYVKVLLQALNIIKLPFPAIEFNTLGQVVFHPIHFLNFSMPVYFKK